MPILTKQQILDADDLQVETVEVPEWGGEVFVRGLSGTERDAWEQSIIDMKQAAARRNGAGLDYDFANFRAKLVARCIVDEDGQRLFGESEIGLLGRKSAAALDRVFTVAQRLSGLSSQDVEELTKN